MSPDAQRIAIAVVHKTHVATYGAIEPGSGREVTLLRDSNGNVGAFGPGYNSTPGNFVYPANYPKDLNAMHEAEKTMGGDARGNYPTYLFEVVCRTSSIDQADFNKFHPDSWAIQATAAQRAEAFLRTLGLWDDTK